MLANSGHLEARNPRTYLLPQVCYARSGLQLAPDFFPLPVSHGWSCWLVECARAGEQLVHVVLWRQAYSPRIVSVGVNLEGDALSKPCMTQS